MSIRPCLVALLVVALARAPAGQEPAAPAPAAGDAATAPAAAEAPPRGLVQRAPGLSPGYVLYSPLLSGSTYLVDREGLVVHTWESDYAPGAAVYLLDDGRLLRCAREPEVPVFHSGGQGGRLQRFTWDGALEWEFVLADEERLLHHDVEPLPNGNLLAIAWEAKALGQAAKAGRDGERLTGRGLWPDLVLEIRPTPPVGGEIVWEWHAWDHLIQDHDEDAEHFGDVGAHPELVDLNGDEPREPPDEEELGALQALGYLGQAPKDEPDARDFRPDWLHSNAISYHAGLDQIALSVVRFHEIWVIDHGTTTAEAAAHQGGRRGRGGDLLYRWGNPAAYRRGGVEHRWLYAQHDVRWIPAGHPGAGSLMAFNNGGKRPDGDYSSVIEWKPPLDREGRYALGAGAAFGPQEPVWEYMAEPKESFFSAFISGAHRLRDGNTFVCSGAQGRFFEVTPLGEIVWEFWNPYSGDIRNADGSTPHPGLDEHPLAAFRATFLPADHPGLAGRNLAPLDPQPPGDG